MKSTLRVSHACMCVPYYRAQRDHSVVQSLAAREAQQSATIIWRRGAVGFFLL